MLLQLPAENASPPSTSRYEITVLKLHEKHFMIPDFVTAAPILGVYLCARNPPLPPPFALSLPVCTSFSIGDSRQRGPHPSPSQAHASLCERLLLRGFCRLFGSVSSIG